MARFSRMETLNTIEKIGVVPVFYNPDIEISKEIIQACYKGGAEAVEMTNRGDHAVEVFSELEKYCRKELPGLILGVGSVIDAPTAAMYVALGANFIVGPILDEETAIICNKHKIPYSPGCGSATEIHKAHSLGVEFCKVFPGGQVGGPAFVKAILGPCPWIKIMPTGGVDITEQSLTDWFKAGVACVGIGSKLITKEIVKNKDFEKLTSNVRNVIETIKKVRGS
jgi:2-dehydro-3-deoxyphosphogluconate aldolase / (4S)-4-hydroxy-2-oxoglutarate aldolase